MSAVLPHGWMMARLNEVACPIRTRRDPRESLELPFIGMEHVEAQTTRLLGTAPAASVRSSAAHFLPGDVLYGRLRPYLNKVWAADREGLCSAEFIPLTPARDVRPRFVQYRLNAADFVAFATSINLGDRPRVDYDQIGSFSFGVPPSAEQDRIIQAIDSQFSRLDEAVALLERVQRNLKRYRAAVLQAAVEGRLVPTEAELARAGGRDYEPAGVLLKRILAECRSRWEEAELLTSAPGDSARGRRARRPQYKEPPSPDTSPLPLLPEGWCWATLPQLGELPRGKSKHRPRNDPRLLGGPYPFIQTGDVQKANGFITSYTATYSRAGLAQSRLWPAGTLCITIAANIAATGILAFDACFPDSVVGFVCAGGPVQTRFVELFLRTERDRLKRLAPATAQKNINLDTLSRVAIALPPADEQARIVAEVDRLLSLTSDVASACCISEARIARLRRAGLRWAFEGRLVDQDQTDEPAAVLLERIRRETAARGNPTEQKREGRRARRGRIGSKETGR